PSSPSGASPRPSNSSGSASTGSSSGKRLPSSATSAFASGDDLLALSDLSAVFSGRRGSSAGALSRASLVLLWRSRWYTCEKLEASAGAGSLVLAGRAGVDREGTSTAE